MVFMPGDRAEIRVVLYYDNFIDNWANGKYYPLWMMAKK